MEDVEAEIKLMGYKDLDHYIERHFFELDEEFQKQFPHLRPRGETT